MEDIIYEPEVGVKLLIENDKEDAKKYTSQLLDKPDDKKFIISGPIEKGSLVAMHVGEELIISYFIENVGRFMFKGIITRRSIKKFYMLEIEITSPFEKIQLRNYYRLFVKLPAIKYFENTKGDVVEEKCITQDISGGGMQVKCNLVHALGDEIEIDLRIEDKIVPVKGKVMRVQPIEEKDFQYSIGIKFHDVDPKSQEIIIRYVFEEQRNLRKKGLI